MSRVKAEASKVACVGMLAGMLLLAIAGTIVVTSSSSPLVADLVASNSPDRRLTNLDGTAVDPALAAALDAHLDQQARTQALIKNGSSVYYGSLGGNLLIGLCFAFLYNKNAVQKIIKKKGKLSDRDVEDPDSDDFENGIFGCFDDFWVLIHGLCCPLVRMAHTNAVAGIMDFWTTIFAYFCCAILTGGIGPCCLTVMWRRQLKEAMKIEDHCVNDLVVTCLCPNLAICQQGTAVDTLMGYEVTGCCDVEFD